MSKMEEECNKGKGKRFCVGGFWVLGDLAGRSRLPVAEGRHRSIPLSDKDPDRSILLVS